MWLVIHDHIEDLLSIRHWRVKGHSLCIWENNRLTGETGITNLKESMGFVLMNVSMQLATGASGQKLLCFRGELVNEAGTSQLVWIFDSLGFPLRSLLSRAWVCIVSKEKRTFPEEYAEHVQSHGNQLIKYLGASESSKQLVEVVKRCFYAPSTANFHTQKTVYSICSTSLWGFHLNHSTEITSVKITSDL